MSRRILLVEDEENLAYALSFNLGEEGYEVDAARNAAEARTFLAGKYDLVVLDVMLPDDSGFVLAQELRARHDLVPILMLTARGNEEDVVAGLEAGADDYMSKPFALGELLGRIRALLRRRGWERRETRRRKRRGSEFRFGTNRVDFSTRKVRARGRNVKLTELEMRLLEFFVEHADEEVSRDELLAAVWEMPPSTVTRTVDNYLVRLRRLFEKDPARPRHFLTVRGVGYRFVSRPE